MKEFKYYVKNPSGTSVEDAYSADELATKIVVQNTATRSHIVFDSMEEFVEHYQYDFDQYHYDEAITNLRPQRLKLDIDSKHEIDIDRILEAAILAFRELWPANADPEFVICTAHGVNKYSYHIIFYVFVQDNLQCQLFTSRVVAYSGELADVIDISVNKRLQYFRMVGSSKPRENRPFLADRPAHLCLVSPPGNWPILPVLVRPPPIVEQPPPEDSLVQKVLAVYKDPAHVFRCVSRASGIWQCLLDFDRVEADTSVCGICQKPEPHQKDNTMRLAVKGIAQGRGKVYRLCRRGGAALEVGEIEDQSIMPSPEIQIQRAIDNATPITTLFGTLPNKLVYDDPQLRDFSTGINEDTNTLCVKANTKMGKTKKLKEFIDNRFDSKICQARIVFLSFRQTFSSNIKERFPDFTLYSEVKGDLVANRVIVQVESLHRLATLEPIDLLILDECESILGQFSSGLHEQFNVAWAKFKWMLRTAKFIVAMDAHLSNRSFKLFERQRPDFKTKALFHYASYKNATNEEYYLTHDRAVWFGALAEVANANRVAIPISSLTEARGLEAILREKLPGKQIKIYSSETNRTELKEHFSDVGRYWSQYDILIYTPTITAGVSFELDHFGYIFGYFVHTSCDAATCHQMLARIRNVRAKKSVIYLDPRKTWAPTDPGEIERLLVERRLDLSKNFGENFIQYEIADNGRMQVVKTDYWHLLIDNIAHAAESRRNFASAWCSLAKESGVILHQLAENNSIAACGAIYKDMYATGKIFVEQHGVKKTILSLEHAEEVSRADDISAEKAKEMSQVIALQEEQLSRPDYLAFEKYKLRKTYEVVGNISPEFVLKYQSAPVKRAFRNLRYLIKHINESGSMVGALRNIQAEEQSHWLSYGDGELEGEANAKYNFAMHRKIHAVVTAMGWQSIFDQNYLAGQRLLTGITPDVLEIIRTLSAECSVRPFTATNLGSAYAARNLVKCIGLVLFEFYRFTIKSTGTVYRIEPPEIFDINLGPPKMEIRAS